MKVLYMTSPGNPSPQRQDFVSALGDGFEVTTWTPDQPFDAQVQGSIAVVDATVAFDPAWVPAAREAGAKLWQMLLAGYDNLDLDVFRSNDLPVANTPGQFSARGLAEHALMLMLCTLQGFTKSQHDLRSGVFFRAIGHELSGRTLGLIGTGSSGREFARLCQPLGLPVVGINPPGPSADEAARLGITMLSGLEELLSVADVISIHVPLAPDTRGLLGKAEFGKMKPGAILINVARGPIVDQDALVDALREGQIAGAGLDVFAVEPLPLDDPLLTLDNVVLTPHVAGATYETAERRAVAAAENVRRVARGDDPLYLVGHLS